MERERRSRRHVLATVCAAVALSACGGGSDGDDGASPAFDDGTDDRHRVARSVATFADGRTVTTRYRYDAEGRLVAQDIGDSVRGQTRYSFAHDALGRRVTREDDVDGDGRADRRRHYRYRDDSGELDTTLSDVDVDGRAEFVLLVRYDDEGLARSAEQRFADLPVAATVIEADGALDTVITFDYDERDRVTFQSFDYDVDGVTEELHELRYDERDRVLTIVGTRTDGTGGFVDEWTYEDGPCIRAGRNSADRYLCVDAREAD